MCDHSFPGKVCMPDPVFLAGDPVITLDSTNGEVVIGGPPGGAGHRGHLVITNADGKPTFTLDGATGAISQTGDIVLLDDAGHERIRITGQGAEMVIKNTAGDPVMRVGGQGDLVAGGGGENGDLVIKNASGDDIILMDGDEGDISVRREIGGVQRDVLKFDASQAILAVGSAGNEGDISVYNNAGQIAFHIDGGEGDITVRREVDGELRDAMKFDASQAALYLGSQGNEGDLVVRNNAGQNSVQIDGNEGDLIIRREIDGVQRQVFKLDASSAFLYVGCEGNEGDLVVRDGSARDVLRFDGATAALYVGASGNEGDIIVRNNAGQNSVQIDGSEGDVIIRREIDGVQRQVFKLDASHAILSVGCEGNEGDIIVRDGSARNVFHFDSNYAALYVGAEGNEGDVIVRDGTGAERIRLDGGSGDIQLHGADCAEEFEVKGPETIPPGTVLVIDDGGHLRPSSTAYDKKVAGVVSGGNGNNPGIVLGKTPAANRRLPVALNGKVYCLVDAQDAAIEVGDLLTTSSTPGHAMKAADPTRAFGAVIGKALSPVAEGTGTIPVLVALQ